MRFCPACGTERLGAAAHCRECGREFPRPHAGNVSASDGPESSGGAVVASAQHPRAATPSPPRERSADPTDRLPPIPPPARPGPVTREPPVEYATRPPSASRSSRLPLIVGTAALVLAAGVAAAVLASGQGSHRPHRSPTPKLAGVSNQTSAQSRLGESSSSGETPATSSSGAAPTVTSPNAGSDTGGSTSSAQSTTTPASHAKAVVVPATASTPLGAVEHYWTDIHAHDFAGAYGYLLPGSIEKTEGQFVAEEKHEHVGAIGFRGTVSSRSGSVATIAILTLVTHDSTYGCRSWSGSYEMQESSGGWLIGRANLSPRSCG
jgi:hypothetical protein